MYGRHAVREAIGSDGARVLEVMLARGASAEDRRALRALIEPEGIPLEELTRDALTQQTGASRHDQGVAARIELQRVSELEAFLERRKGRAARQPLRLLGLDGVTNPQNVGMVVRSVVAAGLDGLVWPRVGQPWVNGLVVRAAAGAIFECPILVCDRLESAVATLQASGVTCIGLDAEASTPLFSLEPPHRAAWLLGSESQGLSPDVRSLLDACVSIPMAGRIESLNVAVAAGLVCFHAAGLLRPASA